MTAVEFEQWVLAAYRGTGPMNTETFKQWWQLSNKTRDAIQLAIRQELRRDSR